MTPTPPSSETMTLNDRAYEIPVDGIQARYRIPNGEWSSWAHVICGVKGHEMELRAVGFYPDRRDCLHPSWENAGNGKWHCACCNVIGDERRYLQPDGELDRVYDRAERREREGYRLSPASPIDALVEGFSQALREKLHTAEAKYGYNDAWQRPDWQATCIEHMHKHIAKGDPRDVAAYCAFAWHHGWSLAAAPDGESK